MPGSYIVAGARTPIGKLSGALAPFSAAQLGGFAISEALKRAGINADQVDHVIVGQVLTAGQGQIPARQAATKAGIAASLVDRLTLTDTRFRSMLDGVEQIADLPDLVGKQLDENKRPNGLLIRKIQVPIGVVAKRLFDGGDGHLIFDDDVHPVVHHRERWQPFVFRYEQAGSACRDRTAKGNCKANQ